MSLTNENILNAKPKLYHGPEQTLIIFDGQELDQVIITFHGATGAIVTGFRKDGKMFDQYSNQTDRWSYYTRYFKFVTDRDIWYLYPESVKMESKGSFLFIELKLIGKDNEGNTITDEADEAIPIKSVVITFKKKGALNLQLDNT